MFKKLKNEIYTYYKMAILVIISVAGIIFMGQSQVAQDVLSGLAIFLLGMLFLEDGFKGFSGGVLEKILKKFSNTKFKSIIFGLTSTAIMQSSTLVTILTLSFLSASLVTLGQALGIVFGANIGSTTSGWIIAGIGVKFNISALGLPLITLGVLLLFGKGKNLKSLGYILAGIGFFFLGISYIKTGFESYSDFNLSAGNVGAVGTFIIFFFMGILITSIVQSSFATLTMVILALNAGGITYDDALALVIGVNVGGVVTALIASISSNVDGRRLAIGNTLFNLVIAVVCIILLPVFKEIVEILSEIFGFNEDDLTLKIALFHTTYNVIAVLICAPFIPVYEKFLTKFITTSNDNTDKPKFLDKSLIPYKNTAKEALENEVIHLFSNAISIVSLVVGAKKEQIIESKLSLETLSNLKPKAIDDETYSDLYNKQIKVIFNSIIDFSVRLNSHYGDDVEFMKYVKSLQKASRAIVESTKNLALIKTNIVKNAESNNPFLQESSLNLRYLFADTIRQINEIKDCDAKDFENILKALDKNLKKENKKAISTIETLLEDGKITPSSATSILNDFAFSVSALRSIIVAAKCLTNENLKPINNDENLDSIIELESAMKPALDSNGLQMNEIDIIPEDKTTLQSIEQKEDK